MRRPRAHWLALALLAAAGCRSRSDLVEAELRTKDRQLRETRAELMRAETMNDALENTLKDQRCADPLRGGPAVVRPGLASQVKDIQLGRGTGGIDEDRVPGDEGLQIVLMPRDVDGSAIKASGTLRVSALEITPEGLKTPLWTWEVSALQLRRSWRSGLLNSGYFVTLPWQKVPTNERLRVVATFMPLEGGIFEAERDVTIHLFADAQHLRPPLMPSPGGLAPPAPVGPMPRTDTPTLPPPEPLPQAPTPGMPPTKPGGLWQPVPASAELLPPRPATH
jgi:hypothetical protein